ncbi:MAG TPA: hypothetical protein VI524_10210 [Anaerolineales bacterium]|nr:hypothetical protein [Anaerolineales bacterium]
MKKPMLKPLVILLVLQVLVFGSPSAVRAEEMTCPPHTPVSTDIKPPEYPNKINLSARGLLPVAVLTTQDFDASRFTPEMAHLSDASTAMTMGCVGAAATRWKLDDVNGNGQLDLVFFFRIQDLNLTTSSTAATLMAHGPYGSSVIHILGTDSVLVKP